jgi:hypothetical protein
MHETQLWLDFGDGNALDWIEKQRPYDKVDLLYDEATLYEGGAEGFDLNGQWFSGDEDLAKLLRDYFCRFERQRDCPFCHSPLDIGRYMVHFDGTASVATHFDESYPECDEVVHQDLTVWNCRSCAHWQMRESFDEPDCMSVQYGRTARLSKLRDFEHTLPEGCEQELAQHIRRHPRLLCNMNPERFERLVRDIWRYNFAPCEARHVGGTNDGGVDVIFVDSQGKQWLLQVKTRQRPDYAEGVKPLRELIGTMLVEGTPRGIFVSTADHFTYRAYELVNRVDKLGYLVNLVDRGLLHRMVSHLLPNRPWIQLVESEMDTVRSRTFIHDALDFFIQFLPPPRQNTAVLSFQ